MSNDDAIIGVNLQWMQSVYVAVKPKNWAEFTES